jgi:hypothetical protein
MKRTVNRCEHVIRQAGHTTDGRQIEAGYGGDRTEICGKFGRPVPHIFHVKRPGITTLTDAVEGTVIRCDEHADRP